MAKSKKSLRNFSTASGVSASVSKWSDRSWEIGVGSWDLPDKERHLTPALSPTEAERVAGAEPGAFAEELAMRRYNARFGVVTQFITCLIRYYLIGLRCFVTRSFLYTYEIISSLLPFLTS